MRVQAKFDVVVSEDDDQLVTYGPPFSHVVDDNVAAVKKYKSSVLDFAAAAAEIAYTFAPEVTNGKYLMLCVKSGAVKIRINGAAVGFGLTVNPAVAVDPLLPYQTEAQPGSLFIGPITATTPLTALHLQNESVTATARVIVALVGEAS